MCGRYAASRSAEDLMLEFEATDDTVGAELPPDFNVAPTKDVHVVRLRPSTGEQRQLSVMRWGLVPSWAKDVKIGSKMLNARSESLQSKPAFRTAFRRRRCLVPADGWYEWTPTESGRKQTHYMTPRDGSGVAFAGLWEIWGHKPNLLLSTTIITVPAAGQLEAVHNRMPLVLARQHWQAWLDLSDEQPLALLQPDLGLVSGLELRPVGPEVGNVANEGPGLIVEQQPDVTGQPAPQVMF